MSGKVSAYFAMAGMLKDLNLAASLAQNSDVPLLFGQLARGQLQVACNTMGPQANIDDIPAFVAKQSSVSFGPEQENP